MLDERKQQKAVQQLVKKTLFLVVVAGILVTISLFQVGREKRMNSPLRFAGVSDNSAEMLALIQQGEQAQSWQLAPEEKKKINVAESKNLATAPVVYAFLPYWNINPDLKIDSRITDLSFFRFVVQANGLITTEEEGEETEVGEVYWTGPKWRNLLAEWKKVQPNGRLEVTFFQDDAEVIQELLLDEVAQDTLMTGLHKFLQENPDVKGINYDFEYYGVGGEALQAGMTKLLKKTRLLIIDHHPEVRLTLDVFGRSGYKTAGLYNWTEVAKQVDYVILMAYDYKTRSSALPGPVSPTLGKETWGSDIFDSLRALTEKVPSYQIIMAVPFYGYQWETTSLDLAEARTYPETGQTLTYKKIREMLGQAQDLGLATNWDEQSLTPYFVYAQEDKKYMAFYENDVSLGYKMDLVKGMNLGGVAVWALGYEGDYEDLWETIDVKLLK